RVVRQDDGLMRVEKRRIAMLHRMNLGSIVSDAMLRVKFLSGGYSGMVEEYFITKLQKGDRFILAGRVLAFEFVREMTVFVTSSSGPAITPSWLGGRLPLSANLSHFLRLKLAESQQTMVAADKELNFLRPLFDEQ